MRKILILTLLLILATTFLLWIDDADSGTYLSTRHGNATSGVDRSAISGVGDPYSGASKYTKGHCGHCHEQHASVGGAEPIPPTAEDAVGYILFKNNSGNNSNGTEKNTLCFACHETFNFGLGLGYGRYGVYQGKTNYQASVHNTSSSMNWPTLGLPGPLVNDYGNCHNCHNPHGHNDGSGVIPSMVFKRIDKDASDYANGTLCDICHDGSPVSKDVKSMFNKTYRHPTYTTFGKHALPETTSASFSGTNRHVECTDCHNPHRTTVANPLNGASGIDPTNSTAGAAPTSYTFVNSVTDADHQYKICFKCHTDWAGYGTGTQNLAVAFNPANDSFHWVEKDKYTYSVNTTGTGKGIWQNATFNLATAPGLSISYAQAMMPRAGFTYNDANLRPLALRCSDCHGTNGAGGSTVPSGPHGSLYAKILKVPGTSGYNAWSATLDYKTVAERNTIWCFNCHSSTFSGTGFSNGGSNWHTSKHDDRPCQDCHLAIPHGQVGSGTANQRRHLLKTTTFSETIDDGATGRRSGSWSQSPGHAATLLNCT